MAGAASTSSAPRRQSPSRRSSPFSGGGGRGATDASTAELPRSSHRGGEGESLITRTLRNENDLLRFQLNDIIARDKNQRIELQRLRAHRDVEVASLVQAATVELRGEVEQMKGLLQSTSSQLLQALTEKERAALEKDRSAHMVEELQHNMVMAENAMVDRLHVLEDVFSKSSGTVTALADSVEAFQRHVLPTFKTMANDISRSRKRSSDSGGPKSFMEELSRLENGFTLLRVIVDAKNDTLVLIRGKLKHENEDLRAELQVAQDRDVKHTMTQQAISATNDDVAFEKNMLRQELHSLQNLFDAEVKQLKAKLKMYETEEAAGQSRFAEVQQECIALQNKLAAVEGSRALLESSLRDETSARSQLVSQSFALRKENEKVKTELETLKLNQKFLVRQPRGRIPLEKLDLMNTVNQLLLEMNKLKGEKVALEEEIKVQHCSQVRERVKRTVTARDVANAASDKVGDSELASMLARTRLQQLTQLTTVLQPQLALTECSPQRSMAMVNLRSSADRMVTNGMHGLYCLDPPTRDEFHRHRFGLSPKSMGGVGGGSVQLAGERFSSPS